MDWLESIPKFDGDPSLVSAHIVMFTQIILDLYCDQDDIIIRLFLFSLEEKQRDWLIHSCNPRSISSPMALVREFLKHWGPGTQNFEDTIQNLEDAFLCANISYGLIVDLKEILHRKSNEITTLEKEDDSNEESFECLKENIQEDNEFCEQLLGHCHNKNFLVRFYVQRK
jgi:hypothetical protein